MKNKQLRVIIVVVFALILAVTGLTTKTMLDANQQFMADGFVLIPSRNTEVTTDVNEQYYFSAGAKYRKKFGETIKFKDTSNNEVSMGVEEFLHYNDGSMAAFTKGVVMDLAEIGDNQVTYYGVSDKTTILKDGQDYSMSYLGNTLKLREFIWKIADDTFMLVSPQITIHLAEGVDVVFEDYVQVQYVAGGIARLVHQHGTYQTVSNEAYLATDSGFQLKLTERAFYNGLEKAVSLDEMIIDSSSNLMVDEDKDNESVKIPTFRVVNGKDGADGSDGLMGEDGLSGEDGGSGSNGQKGQNGFDGLEGNSGEWGYDGQIGESGVDAGNKEITDGIVGVVQEPAPIVGIDPDSYVVGANSLDMMLKVSQAESIVDDLEWAIYKRDTMELVTYKEFSPSFDGTRVATSILEPGVDYVFMVTGSYATQHATFSNVNFMTKIFRTDELGLSIEKVQVTEDSIMIKTVKTDDSQITAYHVALYKEDDTTNISPVKDTPYTGSEEFVFKKDAAFDIKSNTKYKIQLINIESNMQPIAADVSKEVKTLKTKPYYEDTDGNKAISAKYTKILTSSRYQTATVSIDTDIKDPDNGIKGYRYELYETLTDASAMTIPVQTKEVQTMEAVTFNIKPGTKYFGRVVVLFDDNEKVVELVTNPSDVVSLEHSSYPTVKFIAKDGTEGTLTHTYDSVSGYIMVEDTSGDMLINHINNKYPLIVSITAEIGKMHTIKLDESVSPPSGSLDGSTFVKYYYFELDGLARDKTHTVSVSGYVNDMPDEEGNYRLWDEVPEVEKPSTLQYLSGYNINVGSPNRVTLSMRKVPNVGDDLFTIAVAFTDEGDNDASYEVGNMEKITLRLTNEAGVTIGTGTLKDREDLEHKSDFSDFYKSNKDITTSDDLPYSAIENQPYTEYVLTDKFFGAEGDARIASGGNFRIFVDSAYDYTHQDEYPQVENKLDIKLWDDADYFTFKVDKSHARVSDPNSAVTVTPIRNEQMKTPDENLDEDTVVGLTIDSGYSLDDVYKIKYYVYELTSEGAEPDVIDEENAPLINKRDNHYWANSSTCKIRTFDITNDEKEGRSVPLWTVYFDEKDPTNKTATSNLSDGDEVLFERGKVYFVRYEVITNGSLDDSTVIKSYPHCAYDELATIKSYEEIDKVVPFYRSHVFALERQEPKLHRYLWDTVTTTGTTTQQWKYLLDDPDNAILAYAGFNTNDVRGTIIKYDTFEKAIAAESGAVINDADNAKLNNLYNGDGKPKNTYDIVELKNLEDGKWYTLDIPYCLFANNTKPIYAAKNIGSKLSVPGDVKAVSDINTAITGAQGGNYNSDTDYVVNGVMVKAVGADFGIADEYGYRIKLTLQGTEIERVAAVKVTFKSKTDTNKVVVYDPVPVKINNNKSGSNYYGYAYLEYEPLVEAGMNQTETTMSVEAYYTTNQRGMASFTQATDSSHKNTFTADGNLFAGVNAWALKRYEYKEDENTGVISFVYDYLKPSDAYGGLTESGGFSKDPDNPSVITKALNGSVFIPKIDAGVNKGFTNDMTLVFNYALTALANTELPLGDNSFKDVMYPNEFNFEMDENGAKGVNGDYYVLEKLNKKSLMIDFGNAGSGYLSADFKTGDGMPGISESERGSSTGMSSAVMQFNIKGKLPDDPDSADGYYIYLQKVDKDNPTLKTKVPLHKYIDENNKIYYLVAGQDAMSGTEITVDDKDNAYALLPDADSDGKLITFSIRGLDKNTKYEVWVMAKNTKGELQELFDYTENIQKGGALYDFTTKSTIDLVSSDVNFIYNSYDDKQVMFQYAIKGDEGTGMRIFYKVYDKNGNEVKCGKQTYFENYGYRLEPLGAKVFYYHSDMAECKPAYLDCGPGGLLKAGETYKIDYVAYRTNNAGDVIDNEVISNECYKEFTMPQKLASPTVNLQLVSGADKVTVRLVAYDREKSIHEGIIYVDVYDMDGNKVPNIPQEKITVTANSPSTTAVKVISGLQPNQAYRIVVTAKLDRDNNGGADPESYMKEETTNTTISANANVSISYNAEGKLVFKLLDVVNFDGINNIVYSIDSDNGATNYKNGSNSINDWMVDTSYIYTTDFVPDKGSYHYTIQFYKDNSLKGSSKGYFTK